MTDNNYTIKNTLSFAEFKASIDLVVEKCFDEFGNYDPTYKEFWTRYCLINYCTDFPLYTSEEHNISEIFEQVYGEECDKIITNIIVKNHNQYNDFCTAITDRINHKLNIFYKTPPYSLTDTAVSSFFDILSECFSNIKEYINTDTVQDFISKIAGEIKDGENDITISGDK